MSIRSLVENQSKLDYQALTTELIKEFGISDTVNWNAVIPAQMQREYFGGELLRLFHDHPNFSGQKDIRTVLLKRGDTSQLLFIFGLLKDDSFSKQNIERITKRFLGGQDAERFVVWFFGNNNNRIFKVVLSGREGKKAVRKSLTFEINQPFYRTFDFILNEVSTKTSGFFIEPSDRWQALWSAFDISVVNKQFYNAIKAAFDDLVENVLDKSFIKSLEIKKHFTIRLIGRIIFCWFLKKKNIISDDVLSSKSVQKYVNYYREILEKLFFDVFNTPIHLRRSDVPNEIAKYPFLNGGLFEDQEDDYRGNYQLYFPNEWFYKLFHDTLERFNFTIDENSSTNEELAIDPEMLGRIFENLLAEQNPETKVAASDRKVSGSYYTPREIVDYMVEQSLIEYLKANLDSNIDPSLIEDFVHTVDLAENIRPYSKEILEKLNSIKILDPACGSGAFPIGILQKLLALKHVILLSNGYLKSSRDYYRLKLDTIRNSIYGSDIQPLATELSRLRCWLSLMVDEETKDIQPLPNLNFKFVTANSLVDLGFEEMLKTMDTQKGGGLLFLHKFLELKDKIVDLTTEYFKPSTEPIHKEELHRKFNQLQKELTAETISLVKLFPSITEFATKFLGWEPFNDNAVAPFFSSSLMFGISEGFDIVIGNPPYIKEYTNKSAFDGIRESIYYQGKMDIWYFFACRFLDHLKPNTGVLTFIATNNWTTNSGASKLRNKVINDSKILKLVDFGSYMIFESASIQTMILILKREANIDDYTFDYRKLENTLISFNDILDLINKRQSNATQYLNPFINRDTFKNQFLVFGSKNFERILSIIKGKSNFILNENEATNGIHPHHPYVTKAMLRVLDKGHYVGEGIFALSNEELKEKKFLTNERKLVKPYYSNSELVYRYFVDSKNKEWIIYTTADFRFRETIRKFPNIQNHLDQFSDVITSDNKPYGLHRSREQRFFIGEKIVSLRKCVYPTFSYSNKEGYFSAAFYIIKSSRINLKYLTALLNSSIVAFWLKNKGKMQGNIYQIDKEPLLNIPLREIQNTEPFEIMVDYLTHLHEHGLNPEKQLMINYFESILDAMTFEVYFEEILKKADKDIIKHLSSLEKLSNDQKESDRIVFAAYEEFYSNNHPVRKALYYLDSIEEVKIIKESLSKKNLNSSTEDVEEDN